MSHYQTNKTTIRKNTASRYKRNREFVESKLVPCVDCGYFHPAAMDWHHINPDNKRTGGVSRLSRAGASLQTLQEEIDKCVCLCSNCHRIRHAEGE